MCQLDFNERCPECRSHALVLFNSPDYFDHFLDQTGWVSQSRDGRWIFHTEPRRGVRQFSARRGSRARSNWVVTTPRPPVPNGVNLDAAWRSCGLNVTYIEPGGWRLYNNRTWAGMMMVRNFHSDKSDFFDDIEYTHEVVFSTQPMIRLVRTATNHVWWINWDDPAGDFYEQHNWIPGAPYEWVAYRPGMDLIGPQSEGSFWLSDEGRELIAAHPHRTQNFAYQRQKGGLHERRRS